MEEILQKYNEDKESKQKLEKELNMAKMHKEKDEERLEEAINEFGEHAMDDYGSAVIQSYKEKIQTDASEIEKIERNINEVDDNMSKIATDRNIQAMTIGIEKIEKEIKIKNIELSRKEIELQEFYLKDDTEGKLAQDFYNELDNIKKEISDLESKKQQYEELLNVAKEIRNEFIKNGKYNELNKEDTVIESEETKTTEETKPTETKTTEETKPAGTKATEETKPAGTKATEETKPVGTKTTEETKPVGTKTTEGTKPVGTKTTEGTKPATAKPTKKTPETKEPEGLQIKEIKIGEEIIIKYDTITLKERKLDFKQVKSNLEKTDEDKKKALNEIMGADIEWTEEQLDGVDYNMLSALKEARKDGVTKKTAKEILTSYMGAIAGKEEAKQKTKSILTYDRRGMDLLKPSNLFKYMVREKAYIKIKENSDKADEFSKVEVDELGFFRKLFYKNKQLKIEGKKFPREADKNRINKNMNEYYNGQKAQEETKLRDREDIKVDDKVKDNIQNAVSQFYKDMNNPAYNVKVNSKLREASNEKGLDNDNDTRQNDDDHEKARQAVEAYKKQIADKGEGR